MPPVFSPESRPSSSASSSREKRAARDAVVRLTRLSSPELQEIAAGSGFAEERHFEKQSSCAAEDSLAKLLGTTRERLSAGRNRRNFKVQHSTAYSLVRPLSGVSRPMTPGSTLSTGTSDTPLGNSPEDASSLTIGGASTSHTGSAETLPSKARALLDRYSFYSSGLRCFDGLPPRDYSVTGEKRRQPFRVRKTLTSQTSSNNGSERNTSSDQLTRVAKQLIQKVVAKRGAISRSQLERSFRPSDTIDMKIAHG